MKPILPSLLALGVALSALHAGDFKELPPKAVDFANDKNLYLVGYAHLDTQWRWTYVDTTRDYIRNTMEQNFPLLEKYPNYTFNFTGSRRYELMREYYPEDYQKLKKFVEAGRWFPSGSSVDENDANIPSLESMERHFLYGNQFFQREFGKHSEDYLLPDCFGFPASLPTVLAHGGVKGFSTQKLTWGSAVGIPFNVGTWIGPDGSSILATLNPGGYGNQITEDLSKSEMWLKRINEDGAKSGVYADYKYFGIGDKGGAPKESTVEWVEKALVSGGPVRVIPGHSDQIFHDITPAQAAKLPTYKGELQLVNHSAGSISSQAYMKHWNRKNEQLAAAAEGAATMASWFGAFPYPYEPIYQAWDLVLGSQMHDIMPGTSVPKAYEFSWNDEVLALNQFASVLERSTAAVLSQMDTDAQGIPVSVYNPLAFAREDLVEAEVTFPGGAPPAVTAYDAEGQPVPTQILGQDGAKTRVLFPAKAPSLGYATYDLRAGAAPTAESPLRITDHSLENARYRVTINADGNIASIFDKSLKKETLSAPVRLAFQTENPDRYPAWNMDWKDRALPPRAYVSGPAKFRIVESGPARVALEVERTTENSTFTEQIRLAAGSAGDRVEILDRIDWRSFAASLKAEFPLAAANPEASFDDKVGVVRRGNNNPKCFEMPQQQWMDLTDQGGAFGASVLNDSKYACDKPNDHTLRLTLIYTPGTRGETSDQGTQDQGRHEILYALASHQGDWIEGRTPAQAARLNQPLRAFLPPPHPGPLGKSFSLLSLDSEQVQVVAVKQAEDSTEVVVRLKELTGKPANGVALRFAAPIVAAREINGQEQPVGSALVKDGALSFDMKGFGLRAYAIKLGAPPTTVAAVTSEPVPLDYDRDVISSRAKRDDGAMNAGGANYPAEMFPAQVKREGVEFRLGSTTDGAKNALTARGQTIKLPAGNFNRVHLLVAADGDASAQIKIGEQVRRFNVPSWTGYLGQWDNRVWPSKNGNDDLGKPPVGLTPGFINKTPVAWFTTHHNTPQGDAYYEFSYLFELSYDLPAGTTSVTLPDDSKIRIFAVSQSREPAPAPPAAPLYETFADHQPGEAPIITQAGQTFLQAMAITLLPPLYHEPGRLHYTLDGTEPTAESPVYESPFFVSKTTKITAREIPARGPASAVAQGIVTIHDQTAPQLTSVLTDKANTLNLGFSEPLDPASASKAENYSIKPALAVSKVTPSTDDLSVQLTFAAPIPPHTAYTITVHGLKDAAIPGNLIQPVSRPFNAANIVSEVVSARLPADASSAPVFGLPVLKTDNWTMNLFVKATAKPKDRVLIAGFGQTDGESDRGTDTRYFAVFPDGIRFWYDGHGHDVESHSPLDLDRWQMLTAVYDGTSLNLYKDGQRIAKGRIAFKADSVNLLKVGPADPWKHKNVFAGNIQNFTVRRGALNDGEVKKLYQKTAKPAK